MELRDIYDLFGSYLDNCTDYASGKMKRVKLPIPKEYGGGCATGFGYEEAVRNLINRVKDQIKEEKIGPLFSECLNKWIELKEGQNKSPNTISSYHRISDRYILPFFGQKRIDDISPDDIQRFFNSLMKLSKSTSQQCKAVLSGVFDRAVRMGYILQNPMLYKYDHSIKQGSKVVLQDEDLLAVIRQIDGLKDTGDIRDYLYFCFLCFTALRRGEILGLKWSDIDFVNDEIYVRRNVIFPNGQNEGIITCPKDGSSGIVHLNSELKKRIESFKTKGYILPYSEANSNLPMTRSMFIKMWNRCKKVVNLKGATSHSFRASYVTMMNTHCTNIDPKALQGALRHKTSDLALKVYTKENTDKTRQAEVEYDQWLSKKIAK